MRQINWNNITINQYFILQKKLIGLSGYERALKIACILHGLNENEIKSKGVDYLARLVDSVKFIGNAPMQPKCTAIIGGKENVFKPMASLTAGEFLDTQSYSHNKEMDSLDKVAWTIARLCASDELKALEETEGHKSTAIIERWYASVMGMNMADFWGLYAFFLNKRNNSNLVFLLYLVNQANKETKTRLEITRAELTRYGRFSLSLKRLRLKISEVYLINYRNLLALRCSNLRLLWNLNKATNEL